MLPRVTIGYAQSLDGCLATVSGESKWISGQAALTYSQQLRSSHDATMVGIGTIIKDNPLLTCRISECGTPARVVLDSRLRLPADSRLIETATEAPVVLLYTEDTDNRKPALERSGITCLRVKADDEGRCDLSSSLETLYSTGIKSVYVEGGAAVITGLLRHKLADRLICMTAPVIIGNGIHAVGDIGVRKLSESLKPVSSRLQIVENEAVWELTLK